MKEALIFDINDDGLNEIVLALTDAIDLGAKFNVAACQQTRRLLSTAVGVGDIIVL